MANNFGMSHRTGGVSGKESAGENPPLRLIQGDAGAPAVSSDAANQPTGVPGAQGMTSSTQPSQAALEQGEADRQLIQRVQQGDRSAFDMLVLKYQSRVAAIIGRYVSDYHEVLDLVQETFVKAFRALEGFRGESAFYTWLYRIAVNTAKNYLESRGRRPQGTVDPDDAERIEGAVQLREIASPERQLQRQELYQVLQQAIAELPEELRTALLLREFDGLSYDDIAKVLDCPIGTVRSRIFRAREAVDRRIAPLLENGD
ncbi:RNA polymerase sigma factor RpoE [Mangrovitalea sediminis]|uniref:RNA polymerase sigma factor RpoE n=1 Tax=Mangrovitalea sediminis TaxID=1982043 RepID=UPI003872CB42